MHIASAISVLDEEYPQTDTRKNSFLSVKEKQVHRETRQRVPSGGRRVRSRLSPNKSTLWLTAEVQKTGRPTRVNSKR